MTDYKTLIDAETWAFIEQTHACYPEDTARRGVTEQRAIYDAMCRSFHAGHPPGVSARNDSLDAGGRRIPIRRYAPPSPAAGGALVVYYHGGGFVVGGLESHDDVCAELCAATGYPLVSVDYRLAPEHVHPAQSDDALAAYRQLAAERDGPLLLCGDSAGGTLCAGIAHRMRGDAKAPTGQVLIYPMLGIGSNRGSYVAHAHAPMLPAADCAAYVELRTGGAAVENDPAYFALTDTDFSGLPPTVMISAECDPLNDDCRDYRDAILAAGGRAHWIEGKGLVHGFLRARHSATRARQRFAQIVQAVAALGRGEWPY
ncbi:MAG: alpha/beta hydrolase [Nitratireductor sp.]|nr:alpha/beta hydrolase [Nitratireductor sp.]